MQQNGRRERERERESGTKQESESERSKKIRAEKRTDAASLSTPPLSLFLFPETFPSTRENGEQNRRNREEEEEEEEGNARAKKGREVVRRPPSSFALSAFLGFLLECSCVLYLAAAGSLQVQK